MIQAVSTCTWISTEKSKLCSKEIDASRKAKPGLQRWREAVDDDGNADAEADTYARSACNPLTASTSFSFWYGTF